MVLAEIVNDAVKKIKENKVFNADLQDERKHYELEYGQLTETEEFSAFKILFDGYLKNGDKEKFYGKHYAQVPLKSTSFFKGLSRNAATHFLSFRVRLNVGIDPNFPQIKFFFLFWFYSERNFAFRGINSSLATLSAIIYYIMSN